MFPTSLKGTALNWFTRLPPASLKAQFATSKPHHLTSLALVNIRQERTKTLRSFMNKIEKITLNIRDLSPEVALHHLVTSLKPGLFSDNLYIKPVGSMDELRQRVVKFMQLEEMREFKTKLTNNVNNQKVERGVPGNVRPP